MKFKNLFIAAVLVSSLAVSCTPEELDMGGSEEVISTDDNTSAEMAGRDD